MTQALEALTLQRWADRLRSGAEPFYPITASLRKSMREAQLAQAERLEEKARAILKALIAEGE